ncbi:hypothetical protein [Burkholderia vietnamiensis]|uniref:hypothetical protein n=2 Tax=Burkholderiaceae TaxID=119060 RepID=UPI001CF445E6|nr:hypothetical protein [Burkholderia vietnamiensis]MCA8270403.1 hypothetical protein [Burkholderia vietnamiensis]
MKVLGIRQQKQTLRTRTTRKTEDAMVFDTMKRELRELFDHVRRTTEWETSVACGKVNLAEVSADARSAHHARLERIVELRAKYDL